MTVWTVTLFCVSVEVLVVWISILVGNFRVDSATGICEGGKEKVWLLQSIVKIQTI